MSKRRTCGDGRDGDRKMTDGNTDAVTATNNNNNERKVIVKEFFHQSPISSSGKLHSSSYQHESQSSTSLKKAYGVCVEVFKSLFLPSGYPHSVSDDYISYQVWDTLQAFSSSIMGTLATHAVLKGTGVGDATASVTAATLTHLLRNFTGMVGGIWFAWFSGSSMDGKAKQWRLVADVLNDLAMLVELISPLFPSVFFITVCFASLFRTIVGVAGGATRATLVRHQAKMNNMADVSAKDNSQETLVNLVALFVSASITPYAAQSLMLTWTLFLILMGSHLCCNYKAVRSLIMATFNSYRLQEAVKRTLSVSSPSLSVPSCLQLKKVNTSEPLFPAKQSPVLIGPRLRPCDETIVLENMEGKCVVVVVDRTRRQARVYLTAKALSAYDVLLGAIVAHISLLDEPFLKQNKGCVAATTSHWEKARTLINKFEEQGWDVNQHQLFNEGYSLMISE
eukprot:m.54607 g.54607  ORF g.54607 m.54607 type:complete len:452 (+) comp7722_c0_seq4:54-1409(+)